MTFRALDARLRRVEAARALPGPGTWADRVLRTHACDSAREAFAQLTATPITASDAEWLRGALLVSDPRHLPWLLELQPAVVFALAAVQSTGHPDPARACWALLDASMTDVVAGCDAHLAANGRPPLSPGQADQDLARLWNLATGAWPGPEVAAQVRAFVAGGPPPGVMG